MAKIHPGMTVLQDQCLNGHILAETRKWKPSGQSYCSACNKVRTDKHRKAHPDQWAAYQKKANLKRYYGITPAEFDALYKKQNGVCAICSGKSDNKQLAVDHNHLTGTVRGLLCERCNTGLGQFKDNHQSLKNAITYLGY